MNGHEASVNSVGPAPVRRTTLSRSVEVTRAREWWSHKLAPMLATGYATAYFVDTSLTHVWAALLYTLVGLAAAAAYVSLINDFTDRTDDLLAGKPNRLEGRSNAYAAFAVALCCLIGVGTCVLAWRHDPLAVALFAASWLAFSLYSFPPVRLKGRGLAGAIADASGAHLFPHMLVAVVVFHASGSPLSVTWLTVVGAWALTHGLRGAIWHQLGDIRADRASKVHSLGASSPGTARSIVQYGLFPVEVLTLVALLWMSGATIALVALALSQVIEVTRARQWFLTITVVGSSLRQRHALHEYYVVYFPLGFLVAAAARESLDSVALVAHLALFAPVCVQAADEACRVVRSAVGAHVEARRRPSPRRRINTWSASAVVSSSEPKPVSSSVPPK